MTDIEKNDNTFEDLVGHVSTLIDKAREHVKTVVNTTMVYTNYGIGYYIVEFEQHGHERATYGKEILKKLSKRLTEIYNEGWSVEQLTLCRKFFIQYSKIVDTVYDFDLGVKNLKEENPRTKIVNTVYQILCETERCGQRLPTPSFSDVLSWSHYLILMRIKNPEERRFYEIEAAKQQWSVRQLQRQYNSSLYERLALSRDKGEVMRLANEGNVIERPADVIKNPFTLEFLGIDVSEKYTETKLERAILTKLQKFLLEMGNGFLFDSRQKKLTFNEDHYFIDLVLYNRLLGAFCLIDLKVDKLTHQDLGQMQMYVNYYDRYVKLPTEKPTIGILLCKEKNDALVELTLPKETNIYAAEYALYLPDKKLLQSKLKEWIEEEESRIDYSDTDD